ncbi:DUF5752 family protein [archaeon]|nr:DUF5752 family protein [archaeon]
MVIDRFYLSNGDSAGDLRELLSRLRVVDEECFSHHVNKKKNDFANWIKKCVKDKVLAKKIEKLKSKEKIILAIDKRINTPARVKKRIIRKIKEAILDGAS